MKLDKLIRMQKPTKNLVHRTKSSMPKGDTVNPYAPFEGLDGLTYQISYPDELNETTNCYAFALGLRAKGNPQRDYIPGFLAGYNGLPKDGTELEARVVADIEKLGRKVLEVIHASDIPEHLPKAKVGTVWIKALVGECIEGDIHFMVKNEESGRWIHKMGWTMPPKVVVRNLEMKNDVELLCERDPSYKEIVNMLGGIEFVKSFFSSGSVLAKSELESCDDGAYFAIPDFEDELKTYKPLWVMRISE